MKEEFEIKLQEEFPFMKRDMYIKEIQFTISIKHGDVNVRLVGIL